MIHTFIRHCNFSSNSVGKVRPDWFGREECLQSVLNHSSDEQVKVTIMFDGEPSDDHFLTHYNLPTILAKGGTDGHSFLNVVNYVAKLDLDDDDIVYFCEDDYLHAPGWDDIMLDGFNKTNAEYITLYDHKDKYFLPAYANLTSKVIATEKVHWRTTPSTTNTYACRFKTFKKHLEIHREYCDLEKGYTRDHDKFIRLWNEGSNLISSIPGYSTHMETPYMSPVVDWEKYSYIN